MTSGLHRLAGVIESLAAEALAGPCVLSGCTDQAAGYIQGSSQRPTGVCARHIPDAEALGYAVHREVPTRSHS